MKFKCCDLRWEMFLQMSLGKVKRVCDVQQLRQDAGRIVGPGYADKLSLEYKGTG